MRESECEWVSKYLSRCAASAVCCCDSRSALFALHSYPLSLPTVTLDHCSSPSPISIFLNCLSFYFDIPYIPNHDQNNPEMNRDKILTAAAVERMIAAGQTIVVFEDSVLKLDGWMDRHPGGRLAVLHMVGRDATDEMKA